MATPESQTSPPPFSNQIASAHLAQDENFLGEEGNGGQSLEVPPHQPSSLSSDQSPPRGQMTNPRLDEAGGSGSNGQELEQDRPYPCEVCGRKFIRATHLRRHMRIHTGEKPFGCHICGQRYARGDYLRAHIQAHRREKIHKCKHCGEVFHDLTRYADHCRLLHKDADDQFGNPKPPPEGSPPPPPMSVVLESSLVAEMPEEITIVPSLHMREMSPSSSSVPITLVTLPNPSLEQDVAGSTQPHSSVAPQSYLSSQATSLPTSYAFSPQAVSHHMTSSDPHLPQLNQAPAPSRILPDTPLLIPNGHMHLMGGASHKENIKGFADPSPHEVYPHDSQVKATPISYVDNVVQYIYTTNNHNGNGSGFSPSSSPLVSHHHSH